MIPYFSVHPPFGAYLTDGYTWVCPALIERVVEAEERGGHMTNAIINRSNGEQGGPRRGVTQGSAKTPKKFVWRIVVLKDNSYVYDMQ